MKLKFKHQKFQAEAAKAIVDVFKGQPYLSPAYMIDEGLLDNPLQLSNEDFTGWKNQLLVPSLTNQQILENIKAVQRANQIEPSEQLENTDNTFNLTVEMETGVGKTYTYIKTMYELNKQYGWSKFIIVVPSIAIREGVYKSFQVTQEHFSEEYGKKIKYFIYDSKKLTEIDRFASDSGINVMIINSQAFNARGKDARRIHMKLDEFRSRRPIDIIASTNPIVIIDEPQSVEGKQTKKNLKDFNALATLRYSATHKKDAIYNMVYRLDAMEAYNKRLVKKIEVKGITQNGNAAMNSFLYLDKINLSKAAPTASLKIDYKAKTGVTKRTLNVSEGDNLFDLSNELEEYKNGYTVKTIDGRENEREVGFVEFVNGVKISVGDFVGEVNEMELRRIQIRETILSHIEKERNLYHQGIKVLSLFFIDEVAKYKQYDESGNVINGSYADIFEQEYNDIIKQLQLQFNEDKKEAEKNHLIYKDHDYSHYLDEIDESQTHAGYFSIDKKGKLVDGKITKKTGMSDDVDAYDLIMKNKELLLDLNPKKSPVRFIFSHSALREGWDNPNVFQICTLKQSTSEVRKRQEVGRGLRLCVNNEGVRMDKTVVGKEVHDLNVLTVIASESYDEFAKALQHELSEAIANRPRKVTPELFIDKEITNEYGEKTIIDNDLANKIYYDMIMQQYIDRDGVLTEKYRQDRDNGTVVLAKEVEDAADSVINILDGIYDKNLLLPDNARANDVELDLDQEKLNSKEFKALWKRINKKSYYTVDFDTEELIKNSIISINNKLNVPKIYYKVETGHIEEIESKEYLISGEALQKQRSHIYDHSEVMARSTVKYDLIGKIVDMTGLTRRAVIRILQGIKPETFNQFKVNPEEFILKAADLINEQKATAIIQHISYNILDEEYDTTIFTEPTIKGKLGTNTIKTKKHLYDHVKYDSDVECNFAGELDTSDEVAVYVKLPSGFYIATPVGKYNPDWAIAFNEGTVKHIYFVAETKGSMQTMELREIERSRIHCAKEHFKAISDDNIKYDVVKNYTELMNIVRGNHQPIQDRLV